MPFEKKLADSHRVQGDCNEEESFRESCPVTGGSRGLGAATAGALADQGADVAISYVASRAGADAVVNGLKMRGARAIAIQADQGDPSTSAPLIHTVVETFDRLDVLVNNAAVAWQGKTIDDPEIDNAAMDRQWAINAIGVIANIRAASRVMLEGGRIISVGSGPGTRVAFPRTADYAATKATIVGYSRGAARDLGRRNITRQCRAGRIDGYRHGGPFEGQASSDHSRVARNTTVRRAQRGRRSDCVPDGA